MADTVQLLGAEEGRVSNKGMVGRRDPLGIQPNHSLHEVDMGSNQREVEVGSGRFLGRERREWRVQLEATWVCGTKWLVEPLGFLPCYSCV